MILRLDNGWSSAKVAAAPYLDDDTIRTVFKRDQAGRLGEMRLFDGHGRRGYLSREQEAEPSVPTSALDGANNTYLATAGIDNAAVTANTDDPSDVLFGV